MSGRARARRAGAPLALAALLLEGALLLVVPGAAAAGAAAAGGAGGTGGTGSVRPVVVQVGRTTLDGQGDHGAEGPVTFRAAFDRPTRPGDLLVAGIVDGVAASGMRQPSWHVVGWRRGAEVVGGETATDGQGAPSTGGLQAAIWYRPDSPGGVTSVTFGTVPTGTVSEVTAVVAELSGVPASWRAAVAGTSTSGPRSATDTDRSTVRAARPPPALPALVIAVFTNGGTDQAGERFERSPAWHVLGQDTDPHGIDQPILLDDRIWSGSGVPEESMRYGETIDNCAAIVALG